MNALLPLVRKHGRNLHSFLTLEPGLSVWRKDDDAAVAYVDVGGCVVAAGGPLCAADRSREVAAEFAAAHHKQAVFFGVSRAFVDRLRLGDDDDQQNDDGFDVLPIGQVPVWSPRDWPSVVKKADKLRNRLKRAAKLGVVVRNATIDEVRGPLGARMSEIADSAAAQRALPAMGFMVRVELFDHAEERRYFVAEVHNHIVGFAVCVPVYGRDGWLLEDMMVDDDAPAGCGEALVDGVMVGCADASVVSLGMVVLAGVDEDEFAARHVWWVRALRLSSRVFRGLYNFEGLLRFRDKLRPTAWEPVYVVTRGPVSFRALRAVLMAFCNGWVPRFALQGFVRGLVRRVRRIA